MSRQIQLKRWNDGDPLSAAHLNEAVDSLRDNQNGTQGAQPGGVRRNTPIAQQFIIIAENADTLTVQPFDGVNPYGTQFNILKPDQLQRSNFDGQDVNGYSYVYSDNHTRVATKDSDSTTQTQTIQPEYNIDDVIYALAAIRGFNEKDIDNSQLNYVDANFDGRAFLGNTTALTATRPVKITTGNPQNITYDLKALCAGAMACDTTPTLTMDGYSVQVNDYVLVTTTVASNPPGLWYLFNATGPIFGYVGQCPAVAVAQGAANGRYIWFLAAANTYKRGYAFYK